MYTKKTSMSLFSVSYVFFHNRYVLESFPVTLMTARSRGHC